MARFLYFHIDADRYPAASQLLAAALVTDLVCCVLMTKYGRLSRDFYGKPRRFCGYEDLLAMKRAANRDQDRIDVNSLKQARREL